MVYQNLTQPMSLAGLSGGLNDNVARLIRAKQRGFQAATEGDLTSSLSEAMARPEDDLLTEAMTEQGATLKNAPGLPVSIHALASSNPDLAGAAAEDYYAKKYPGARRMTQGTTMGTPIEQ